MRVSVCDRNRLNENDLQPQEQKEKQQWRLKRKKWGYWVNTAMNELWMTAWKMKWWIMTWRDGVSAFFSDLLKKRSTAQLLEWKWFCVTSEGWCEAACYQQVKAPQRWRSLCAQLNAGVGECFCVLFIYSIMFARALISPVSVLGHEVSEWTTFCFKKSSQLEDRSLGIGWDGGKWSAVVIPERSRKKSSDFSLSHSDQTVLLTFETLHLRLSVCLWCSAVCEG